MAIAKLKVTQIRSCISQCKKNRAVVQGLGLTRVGKSVVVENTSAFRGMIRKVIHLLKVEESDV